MKKLFTLVCTLMGFAGAVNAASVDDLPICKHSIVVVCDDYTNNGTGTRVKGALFGDGYFLDYTGGSVATNKGKTNLAVVDPAEDADGNPLVQYVTQDIVDKYGEYGEHLNSLRLKNTQDIIAMKPTAGSKIIFFLQGNNKTGKDARYPKLSKNADLSDPINPGPTDDFTETTRAGFKLEVTIPNDWGADQVLYIGSYNGDMFLSYIIVEALEAEGTPSVKVGEQLFENGLWYREVTCKPATVDGDNTIVTYTTDGSTPNENSPVYKAPIKCYNDQTVKFQAYYDWFEGVAVADAICEGADNEANVTFSFDAPEISDDEAGNVTITSPYDGAKNFYSINGTDAVEGSSFTLPESATISAYSQIVNGSYATFTTKSVTKDVYVLTPLSEKVTLVATGTVVEDEEATNDPNNTTGETIYKVVDGAITADKASFFVKNPTFKILKDATAQYQVPEGQEIYIQMSNTNITFKTSGTVDVKVICSKNACKNLDAADAADGSQVNDRKCYVNVSGTNYCHKDAEGNEAADLKLFEDANIIEFTLEEAGIYTFQKYSGTGNILISSIEITPKSANIKGDVNGDGLVTVADITAVINVITGADMQYEATADVNNDGIVTIADITEVINNIK